MNEFRINTRGRKPGRGFEIPTARGERIRRWFYRRSWNDFNLGILCGAVTFADHRSGWSAVRVTVSLGFWSRDFYPLHWRNGPPDNVLVYTLADQIRDSHKKVVKAVDADE